MSYNDALRKAVKVAVRRTLDAVRANYPGETLNGYALVTDDALRTLGYVASTVEYTESQMEPSTRFEPVDWVYSDEVSAFDESRDLLTQSADAGARDDLGHHVFESYATLVEAILELKEEGQFSDAVYLTVISTDPSEQLEALEAGAVQKLNSEQMYLGWKASLP